MQYLKTAIHLTFFFARNTCRFFMQFSLTSACGGTGRFLSIAYLRLMLPPKCPLIPPAVRGWVYEQHVGFLRTLSDFCEWPAPSRNQTWVMRLTTSRPLPMQPLPPLIPQTAQLCPACLSSPLFWGFISKCRLTPQKRQFLVTNSVRLSRRHLGEMKILCPPFPLHPSLHDLKLTALLVCIID